MKLALILAAWPMLADVTVQWSPVPLAVTRAKYGPVREVGEWTVRICNEADEPLTMDAIRIYMTAGEVGAISPSSAAILLTARGDDRLLARIARVLDAGTDVGAVALAAYSSPGAGLGLVLAKKLGQRAKDRLPAIDLSNLLAGTLALASQGCAERVAFAPLRKKEHLRSQTYTVKTRAMRPLIPAITSVP